SVMVVINLVCEADWPDLEPTISVLGSVQVYVQHLLGIGHLRRSLRIVEAMAREDIRVALISGGEPVSELLSTAAERVIQLPPIRARDAEFKALVDGMGRPVDDALR